MSWIQRYKARDYVRNSIWILPVSGMVAALAASKLSSLDRGTRRLAIQP